MTAKHALLFAATLALASCGEGTPQDAIDNGTREATPAPVTAATTPSTASATAPVTSLAGAWRVAGIDGSPLDGDIGIALTGDEQEIWWEPRCAAISLRYRIEGLHLVTLDEPSARAPGATPSPQVACAIIVPPKVVEVGRALRSADQVERTPQNGVLLSGNGHSLLLFSQ